MAGRDDAQFKDRSGTVPAAAGAGSSPVPPRCTCDEFRRNQVCDHVLMAAAVRMVRRMIDIQKDEDSRPH